MRPVDRSQATIDRMALAIVHAHTAALALPVDETGMPAPEAGEAGAPGASPVYSAALQAAHRLGFIAADARCVALAWHRREQVSGRFDATQWPVEPLDFGLAPAPHSQAFAPCPRVLGLYAVLPDAAWVGRMARAGVPTLQLRCKSADPQTVRAEVRQAVAALQGTSARLFINDHWREAIAAGAYGVHLGQEDLDQISAPDLASIRAAGLRLGLSSHGYAEMLRAAAIRPSYIALGAVFPTTLKAMASVPQGVGRLRMYAHLLRQYPLVAIGGIDASRLASVLATGVGAVGVVRALIAADSPQQTAADFIRIIDEATRPDGRSG
jgi:thiamine-phosphate pyrophosphorylase